MKKTSRWANRTVLGQKESMDERTQVYPKIIAEFKKHKTRQLLAVVPFILAILVEFLLWFIVGIISMCSLLFFAGQGDAVISPADVIAVWGFDEGGGNIAKDTEGKGIEAEIVGNPEWVDGIRGKALAFDATVRDGKDDVVKIPNSEHINTGGPFTNRTMMALFKPLDVSLPKQVIYEEGSQFRGFNMYVDEGKLYVGGYNLLEYGWQGSWLSVKIQSKRWYYAALVLRDARNKLEKDKFEMWLNGKLIAKAKGGQVFEHPTTVSIGAVWFDTRFHDDDGFLALAFANHFKGLIDEVRLYNAALSFADINAIIGNLFAVFPASKLATTWGRIKGNRDFDQ